MGQSGTYEGVSRSRMEVSKWHVYRCQSDTYGGVKLSQNRRKMNPNSIITICIVILLNYYMLLYIIILFYYYVLLYYYIINSVSM